MSHGHVCLINTVVVQELYFNKKYVLWNAGICPIASKVGHVTLATPPLGSFIVPYVVLAMAYPKKNEESTFIHLKVMESEVPKFKK